jgi:hypothetical protein
MQFVPQKFKAPLKSLLVVVMIFGLFLANAAHDKCPKESLGWEYAISFFIPPFILLTLVALVWGLTRYIFGQKRKDEHAKEVGKSILIWGLFMLAWLITIWGIIGYVFCPSYINLSQ